ELVFQAGARDLPLVVQLLRADKPNHSIDEKGIEAARHAIGACLQRELIHTLVRVRRERASLSRFEIHGVCSQPLHIALLMMFKYALLCLSQQAQIDSEAAVCSFSPGHRLEEQMNRRAAIARCNL